MENNLELIKILYKELNGKKIIKKVANNSNHFYDEPKLNYYSVMLNNSSNPFFPKSEYKLNAYKIGANGLSYASKETALLKCLSEAAERFNQCCYSYKSITYTTYNELKKKRINALNPQIYINTDKIKETKFGWIKGHDLFDNKQVLLPAQLLYLNFPKDNEVSLTSSISTGAAGGFDSTRVILNGIYEVIERDAFMTVYLNKIRVPKIKISSIKDSAIKSLGDYYKRYRLKPLIFNITNNLQVPVFLTVLLDETGNLPQLSLGMKASLDTKTAILGAMEEAFMNRYFAKLQLFDKKKNVKIRKHVPTIAERALLWMTPQMEDKLDFLTKSEKSKIYKTLPPIDNPVKELETVKKILKKNNLDAYYSDITLDNFTDIDYKVFKIIIPRLQPLYLNEKEKELKTGRIKEVADFFNVETGNFNQVPHPFI